MNKTQTKPITVFIIEDYALIRVGIIAVLKTDSLIKFIGEADNVKSGLEQVNLLKPDIVLMDLGLSDIGGIEATKTINEINPDIKIIVLTSHKDENEVLAALAAGASAYCIKDIEASRFLDVIKTVYDGATWLDPGIAEIAMKTLLESQQSTTSIHNDSTALSERELKILKCLVDGKNNDKIALELFVSTHTVKSDIRHILQKLAVHDRIQAAVMAVKEGLV